jgi:hypothetical protein
MAVKLLLKHRACELGFGGELGFGDELVSSTSATLYTWPVVTKQAVLGSEQDQS